jgi:RNA polymerase sigma factor (sigma-70 family)
VAVPVAQLPEQSTSEPAVRDDALWAALDALPPGQRAAVAYHHVAGLPYAEVAQILGNSEAAARRAAADGIRSLRRSGAWASADE